MLALARGARMRSVAAVAVTVIAVAELVWWNDGVPAQRRARHRTMPCWSSPSAPPPTALDLVERSVGERRNTASARASRSWGSAGPGRTLRWCARSKRSTATIRCASASMTGWWRPARSTWRWSCATSRPPSTATTARSPARSASNSCLLGRPIEEVPHLARRPVADVLRAGPDVWVYRLKDPAPRLKFTRRVQVADADAVSGPGWLAASPAPDRVLIDDDTPPAASYAGAVSAGSARIAAWRPARIEIDVDSAARRRAGAARDLVSGLGRRDRRQAVPILRADVLFRGVEVPAGRHAWCSASRRSHSPICRARWRRRPAARGGSARLLQGSRLTRVVRPGM